MSQNEFYIGYKKDMPKGTAKFLRVIVLLLIFSVPVVAGILAVSQKSFYPSFFEFGNVKTFSGVISLKPSPVLIVERPGGQGNSRYYLVAFGKNGASGLVSDFNGKKVELQGSLIYRDNQTMIEVVEGSVKSIDSESAYPQTAGTDMGMNTFKGEIVDSKCYFGVMNPGTSKVHRSCAIRCIEGGVPPVLAIQNSKGERTHLILVGEGGRMINSEVALLVAEPVEISGRVTRYDNLLVLEAEPSTFKRLYP